MPPIHIDPIELTGPGGQLRRMWQHRCRFTALIGAGLSAASGIPTTGDFPKEYLAHCLNEWFVGSFDPQTGNWPSLQSAFQKKNKNETKTHSERWIDAAKDEKTEKKQRFLYGMAHAIQDWIDALEFLSRAYLTEIPNSTPPKLQAELGPPNRFVHDSFFQLIVRRGEPSLGHHMLVALSDQLRIQLILTTNFDDLIERSFATHGIRLSPFDVHKEAWLPSPRLVLGRPAIIKLHGGAYGLRADASLDAKPAEADRRAFMGYLAGEPLDKSESQTAKANQSFNFSSKADEVGLIVAGYSARDGRMRQMIKTALRTLEKLHVFWFCHTKSDCLEIAGGYPPLNDGDTPQSASVDQINASFIADLDDKQKARLHVIHGDFGLTALEAYQELTGTLPPTGLFFPTTWSLPFPPRIPKPPAEKAPSYHDIKVRINTLIQDCLKTDSPNYTEVCCPRGTYGNLTIAATLFANQQSSEINVSNRYYWIDLDDVLHPEDVFFHIVGILSKEAGILEPRPHFPKRKVQDFPKTHNDADPKAIADWLRTQLHSLGLIGSRRCVFFLNGRDNPGENHYIRHPATKDTASKWPPHPNRNTCVEFWKQVLISLKNRAVAIVLLSEGQWGLVEPNLRGAGSFEVSTVQDDILKWCQDSNMPELLKFEGSKQILEWCHDDTARLNSKLRHLLVYTLVEFDYVRYPAAIKRVMRDCFFFEIKPYLKNLDSKTAGQPLTRINLFNNWYAYQLNMLHDLQLFRRKPGGFLWMNHNLRQALRVEMAPLTNAKSSSSVISAGESVRTHRLIARSYGRLFIASSDPRAAWGTVSHALTALDFWLRRHQEIAKSGEAVNVASSAREVAFSLRHANSVLRSAESLLKCRVPEEHTSSTFGDILSICTGMIERLRLHICKTPGLSNYKELQPLYAIFTSLTNLTATASRAALSVWQVERNGPQIRSLDTTPVVEAVSAIAAAFKAASASQEQSDTHRAQESSELTHSRHVLTLDMEKRLHVAFVSLAKRSYDDAEKTLSKLLLDIIPNEIADSVLTQNPRIKLNKGGWRIPIREWVVSFRFSPTPNEIALIIRLVRRMAYLRMHQGQAVYLARNREPTIETDPKPFQMSQEAYLEEASDWCECGLELLRSYDGEDEFFVYHQHARIRAHLGLIQARQASWIDDTDDTAKAAAFTRAKETLLDAEAFAVEFPLVNDSLSHAIIILRKAELKLLRIRSWLPFRDAYNVLRNETLDAEPFKQEAEADTLLARRRLVHDVWECIDRADELLKPYQKNEWWPQLAFVLRVQAIECQFVTSNRIRARNESTSDYSPAGNQRIEDSMREFMKERLTEFPTQFSAEDIFFLARIAEATLNLQPILSKTSHQTNKLILKQIDDLQTAFSLFFDATKEGDVDDNIYDYATKVRKRIPDLRPSQPATSS